MVLGSMLDVVDFCVRMDWQTGERTGREREGEKTVKIVDLDLVLNVNFDAIGIPQNDFSMIFSIGF